MRSDSRLLYSIVIAQDPKYISCILVTINGLFCLFKHEFEKKAAVTLHEKHVEEKLSKCHQSGKTK